MWKAKHLSFCLIVLLFEHCLVAISSYHLEVRLVPLLNTTIDLQM